MDNRTVHKIAAERQRFDAGEPVDTQIIKPVILESWERSRAYGVNPQNVKKLVLSQEELRHRISQRQEVYDAAVPFLEKLYQFTSGSGFVSVLADEEGYVLKILGDYDAQKKVGDYLLVEGCNRSEQHIGTNGIGTCLATGAPIQVWGNEHYYSPHSDVVCSGAPIFDAEGRLAGCLDLTGLMDKVHYHTLGMVFSAAQAITKQLEMQKTYRDLLQTKNQMSVIIENIQTGLLLLDEDGRILQISTYAAQLLGEAKEAIVGKNISHYIRRQDIDFSHLKGDLTDRPIELGQGDGARRVFASVYKVSHTSSPGRGAVVTLGKVEAVHRTVNKVMGTTSHFTFQDIIGESPAIHSAREIAKIAAKSSATILLTGESGTGKELFAQAIHSASERGDRAFIAINCGSLPRSLIESELFGYERGAFTGAKREGQAGKFELANGGTLFLDEIGDMPADVQVSLLRVLQNKEIVRIGGSHPIKIDVRVIAATNKDLLKAIENNTFRSDLYYRLNVLSIHIPALRERGGDVRVLANYFLKKYGSDSAKPVQGFTDEAYQLLEHYTWPGNIRELENAMERATIVGQEEFITAADLPEAVRSSSPEVERQRGANHLDTDGSLSGAEQSIILRALEEKNGNVTEAALLLGVSRRTLYRKLQKYGIKSRQVRFS